MSLGARRDHDLRSFFREHLGYRRADALARAGDDGDLAVQSLSTHVVNPPFVSLLLSYNPEQSGVLSDQDAVATSFQRMP